MIIDIKRTADIEELMPWRMEVLKCVFSISPETDTFELEQANRQYYETHLANKSHIACIAYFDDIAVNALPYIPVPISEALL